MATGASNAELAVILIDARKGRIGADQAAQLICSLIGIRHVVLAVNKIDLVDYQQEIFERIACDYAGFARARVASVVPIPMSARYGDNITSYRATRPGIAADPHCITWKWSRSKTRPRQRPFRFPVQWINRPNLDFRGYPARSLPARIAVGDSIVVAASGQSSPSSGSWPMTAT